MGDASPRREGATTVRVRYCECDPMGVAHHASFIPWLEHARTELLRDTGVTYAALEREGVFLVVTKLEVRYRRPARYDDVLEIATCVEGGSRVKIRHTYEVRVLEPGDADASRLVEPARTCVVASSELACVDGAGRIRELPGWLVPEGAPRRAGDAFGK